LIFGKGFKPPPSLSIDFIDPVRGYFVSPQIPDGYTPLGVYLPKAGLNRAKNKAYNEKNQQKLIL
jgi:hypothetical protein